MPGTWTALPSICSSRRDVGFRSCDAWADEGSEQCAAWAAEGSEQCAAWADEGSNQCAQWADEGSAQCCDWWPCSWFCDAFYWVANLVCQGWYWVANLVCQAWYWVVNWVCQAWFWVANLVCRLWVWVFFVFCFYGDGGPMFQLTDGGILMNECAGGYGTRRWWKLTPDQLGSYVGGQWTRMADSNTGRKYFASAVLADGQLLVCGGEYSDSSGSNSQDDTNASEIYDPVANTWTPLAAPGGLAQIGDSPCCMLPDGRFLLGNFNSTTTLLRNPATGAWTAAGATGAKGDSGSEETWLLMADGTVVTPQCGAAPNAEMYVIRLDRWIPDGTLQADIVEAASIETGPAMLLTDGRGFFAGATSSTALYRVGATDATPGTWAVGPNQPQTTRGKPQGCKDGPAVLLPSGRVLFPIAPVDGLAPDYLSPCTFVEFDGKAIHGSSNPPNSDCPTYVGRMLIAPTGQALWAREDDQNLFAFTETGQPRDSFRPIITSVPAVLFAGGTEAISGRQFNGLSQAVSYGDDYAAATNYPLVRITHRRTGHVRYCRTANHTVLVGGVTTPSMGVATGAAIVTTQVTVPGNIDLGESDLEVIANGIPSHPHVVTIRLMG